MGEFHNAVENLLSAFSQGVSIITAQRQRRKSKGHSLDPAQMSAEVDLRRTLKKSQNDVASAYNRDLALQGPRFALGDSEAHSSLSAIIFRLNAAFVSVIHRFTRDHSNTSDYRVLTKLSNTSRQDAIDAFDRLSKRMSQASLGAPSASKELVPTKIRGQEKASLHRKANSVPELSMTALGPASPEGWVRVKAGKHHASRSSRNLDKSLHPRGQTTASKPSHITITPPKTQTLNSPIPFPPKKRGDRKSFMSFASDSTNLGEIPEHKWTRPPTHQYGERTYPIIKYHPLEQYQEPERERSRLKRLFKK